MENKSEIAEQEHQEEPEFRATIASLFSAAYQRTTPGWAKLISVLGQFVILIGTVQAGIWIWSISTTNFAERETDCIEAIANIRNEKDVQRANQLRMSCGAILASNFWQTQYGQNHPTAAERIGRDIAKLQRDNGNTTDTQADLLYLKALNESYFDRDLAFRTIQDSLALKEVNPDAVLLYASLIENLTEDQDKALKIIKESNLELDPAKSIVNLILTTEKETGLKNISDGSENSQRLFASKLIAAGADDLSLSGQTSLHAFVSTISYNLGDANIAKPIMVRTNNCESYDHPTLRGLCFRTKYISAFIAKEYDLLAPFYNEAETSFLRSDAFVPLADLVALRYNFWDIDENRELTPHLDLSTKEMIAILQENLKRLEKSGDDVLTGRFLILLGNNLIGVKQQNQDEAYEYVKRAISLFEQHGAKSSLRMARDLNSFRETRLGNSDEAYLAKVEAFNADTFDSLEDKGHNLLGLHSSAFLAGLSSNASQHLENAMSSYSAAAESYEFFDDAWNAYREHRSRGGANFGNIYVRRLGSLSQSPVDNIKFVIADLEHMSLFSVIYFGKGDPLLDEFMEDSVPDSLKNFEAAMTELRGIEISKDEYEFLEAGLIESYFTLNSWPQNNRDFAPSDWEQLQERLLKSQTTKSGLTIEDTILGLATVERYKDTDYSYEKSIIRSAEMFMTWLHRRETLRFKEKYAEGIFDLPNRYEDVDPEFLRLQLRILALTHKGNSDYGVDITNPMRGLAASRYIQDVSQANNFAQMARDAFAERSALRDDQSLYYDIFMNMERLAHHYGQTCQSEAAYTTLAEFRKNWGRMFEMQQSNSEQLYTRFQTTIKAGERKVQPDCSIQN